MTAWRRLPDAQLEQKLNLIYALDNPSEDDEQLAEDIEQELADREEYRANHDDTPSLQDRGYQLGDYAS